MSPLRAPRARGAARACLGALALVASGCFTPPALLPADRVDLGKAIRRFPAESEAVELALEPGLALRGAFVRAGAHAPVVLHLLGSSDTVAASKYPQAQLVAELADLGLASLMIDYAGVGASSGERSVEQLERDAWAMWQAALERADGDPARVGLRCTSIGTVAAAQLLQRGARPGAIALIAPILADSVVERYARVEYGWAAQGLARLLFAPVARIDALAHYEAYAGPLLVCASAQDAFLSEGERARWSMLVARKSNAAWFGSEGGHYRSSLAGRTLFAREPAFWRSALPPRSGAEAAAERASLAERVRASAGGHAWTAAESARLDELLRSKRLGDPSAIAAAALALPSAEQALWMLWSLEQRPYPQLGCDELREVLALDDPAGPLPWDLIWREARRYDEMARWSVPRPEPSPAMIAALAESADRRPWPSWSMGFQAGGERSRFECGYEQLWIELVQRGYALEDARRIFARLVLRAERIPERLRASGGGYLGLEVWAEGRWSELSRTKVLLQFSSAK